MACEVRPDFLNVWQTFGKHCAGLFRLPGQTFKRFGKRLKSWPNFQKFRKSLEKLARFQTLESLGKVRKSYKSHTGSLLQKGPQGHQGSQGHQGRPQGIQGRVQKDGSAEHTLGFLFEGFFFKRVILGI